MIHLSYHPAFDAFHCIFRILRLEAEINIKKIELDKIRILDYFLLFPWRAASIRLSQADLNIRRIAKTLESKKDYATLPSGEILLERMKSAQIAALQTLAQDGVIDGTQLRNKIVAFKSFELPDSLRQRIESLNAEDDSVMEIIKKLSEYPLSGQTGLKARTSLLEYRYDAI